MSSFARFVAPYSAIGLLTLSSTEKGIFLFIGCEGFPLGPVNMHLGLCGDPNAINYDYGDFL